MCPTTLPSPLHLSSLNMYPFLVSAVVPIYRLDAFSASGVQLVLSREAFAGIFTADITWWNDSRIQATNPDVTLPAQQISVAYHNESLALNGILAMALCKFGGGPTSVCELLATTGTSPPQPNNLYYNMLPVVGAYSVAAAVTATDGSIGYAVHAIALDMNNDVAAMVNAAGVVVNPTTASITFAAVELGTAALARTTLVADLTDATGSGVWPICAMSYLLIDTVDTASTCHARQAVVNFWLWFYQSSVVTNLLETRQYARVPDIVMSSLSIIDNLETQVMCRGSTAYAAAVTPARALSVPSSVSFSTQLITPLYTDSNSVSVWTATEVTDQLAFDQLVNAEVDIAMFDPNIVDADKLQEARDSGDFLILPTYMYAMSWLYNPQITSTVNIASYTVRLDSRTLAMIVQQCITVSPSTHTDAHFGLRVCRSLF